MLFISLLVYLFICGRGARGGGDGEGEAAGGGGGYGVGGISHFFRPEKKGPNNSANFENFFFFFLIATLGFFFRFLLVVPATR